MPFSWCAFPEWLESSPSEAQRHFLRFCSLHEGLAHAARVITRKISITKEPHTFLWMG